MPFALVAVPDATQHDGAAAVMAPEIEIDLGGGFCLRRATEADAPAFCEVCLKTGDSGGDASATEDDPDLLGLLYAVPYVRLEPDFAHAIVQRGARAGQDRVAGYLLGTPDSAKFYRRLERDWLPDLQRRVSEPGPDAGQWRGSDWIRRLIHHPPTHFPQSLQPFPAHAHIDLLPEARGCGIGQQCMAIMDHALAAAGAGGVHLQVKPGNAGALRFYGKLGFERLIDRALPEDTAFMVKHLLAVPR